MNKIRYLSLTIILISIFFIPRTSTQAQNDQATFEIRLSRDFGYGGLGNDIQGLFSLQATGPESLVRVDYLLDGEIMGSVNEAPFRFQFQTDNYSSGVHTISAAGYLNDGTMLHSNEIVANFLSAAEGRKQGLTLVGSIFIIVIGGMVLAAFIPLILGRKSKSTGFKPQSYGFLGGAVCPKCGKPFPRHWWGLNLIAGKFDRCPHCGKWSLVGHATPDQLRVAEEMIVRNQQPDLPVRTSGEQLEKDLDNSKYLD